jgi:methylated-DNA-[protein]-cysteine S-methyltransferase
MTTLRHETSLGVLLLTASREEAGGTVLVRVTFADTGRTPAAGAPKLDRRSEPDRRFLRAAAEQIDEYLSGARTGFDLPLAPGGTPFQRTVWQTVSAIPHGTTRTSRDVALAVGRPDRIRAPRLRGRGARAVPRRRRRTPHGPPTPAERLAAN